MGTSAPLLEAKCTRVFCLSKFIFPSFHLSRCKACEGINMHFCTWSAAYREGDTAQHSPVSLSSEPEAVQHLPVQDPPAGRLQGIPEINQTGLGWDTGHPPPWQPLLNSPEMCTNFHTWSPVSFFGSSDQGERLLIYWEGTCREYSGSGCSGFFSNYFLAPPFR